MKKKKHDTFLEKYLKMYQENPRSKIFAPLSESYRKSGLVDEAIEICKEGLEYHPNYISGRVALARAYYSKEMYKETIKELEKVVSEAPANYLAQRLLADSYKLIGEEEKALISYKILHSITPKNEEIMNIIQQIEDKKVNIEKTKDKNDIEVDDLSEETNPGFKMIDDFDIDDELYFEEKDVEDLFKVDTLEDKKDEVLKKVNTITVASILEKQGYYDKALEIYKEILSKNKNNIEIKNAVTRVEKKLGLKNFNKNDFIKDSENIKIEATTNPNDFIKEEEKQKITILKDIKPNKKLLPKYDDYKLNKKNNDQHWIQENESKVKKLEQILKNIKNYKVKS
jgi:tetratricopeptide (TPR) repeat protein